jgi:hypothetical protein
MIQKVLIQRKKGVLKIGRLFQYLDCEDPPPKKKERCYAFLEHNSYKYMKT